MMAMLNSPFRYARKGWQKQYSSLIIPYQVTEYLARRCFLSAANQFHLRNMNFDCEEIWHTATEVGNPRALEYSSSTALLGHFSLWRSVFFSWLLKFNYFCFAIGVFLVCFFSLSQKNIWDLKKITFSQHFLPLLVALTIRRNERKAVHPCEDFSNEHIMWQECQQAAHEVTFNSQIWNKMGIWSSSCAFLQNRRWGSLSLAENGAKEYVFMAQELC